MQTSIRHIVCLTAALTAVTAASQIRVDSIPEIVVTGTGTENTLKNTPVQTEVISGRVLRNFSGRSMEDILGSLTSSFDFNEGDMGSQMQMSGLGNSYILILIDGKRLHGDVGGENDLGLIDPANIERIEIVKGAVSALYGSDAIAGVINIITKRHDEGLLLENTSRVGSYGDLRQHNGIGFRWGKWSSYTNFQLQHSDGWQNTSKEDPRQTEFVITDSRNKTVNRHTNYQVSERLTYQPINALELYAQGSWYWKRIYRPCGKYSSVDVTTYDLEYKNASAALGGKWNLNSTDVVTLDVDWNRHAYYYNFTDTTLMEGYYHGNYTPYFPYFIGQRNLQSDQQRTMAHLKGVFQLPFDNRLSAGLEWRYDYLKAPMRVSGGKASDNTGALYVQDEFTHISPLNITAGFRLNHNEQFGFRFTPKVSVMLSLGDWRIRGTWSEGFKTPTPKEQHYHYVRNMSGTYLYLGNEDLKPQISHYSSLGTEWNIGKLSCSVTGYYNQVDHMITLVTIPNNEAPGEYIVMYDPTKVRQYKNLEKAETYGADVMFKWFVTPELTIGAGYSYLDTQAKVYDTETESLHRVVIDGMAHHRTHLSATWNHRFTSAYQLGLGLYGRMSSKRYYQINGNGKGYQVWRLTSSHDFGKSEKMSYRLEAGVDNIFNYCDRTFHGRHLGTTTPGTTIFASFTIRFSQGKKIRKQTVSNSVSEEE